MFRSLRSRLYLTYLLVTGLVLVIISISLIFFILRFSQQAEYGRLNYWLSNFTGLEGRWVSIHVDDSGPGIPPDELSRIFERFYQLDKARAGGRERGVGLGLAISREIVQAHGGRLVAQSVLDRGSRFTVQLPIIRPDDTTMVRTPP